MRHQFCKHDWIGLRTFGFIGFIGGVLLAWSALPCSAQITYPTQTFTFDTSALNGYVGPFTLDLQLTDGSGLGNGNTSLTVDNFLIDGAASGIASVSLTDTTFLMEEMRAFTPGSTFAFDLSGTYDVDTDGMGNITPDEFSFAILQGDGTEAPTTSPAGGLLIVDFDNAAPAAVTTLQYQIVPAVNTPEPGALALLIGLIVPGGLLQRWRRKHGR